MLAPMESKSMPIPNQIRALGKTIKPGLVWKELKLNGKVNTPL
jgi:hypothetical protein